MKKILMIGATSAIAEAVARIFAARGDSLYLVARNADKLRAVEEDLKVRGAVIAGAEVLDLDDIDAHAAMISRADLALQQMDGVLIAHGVLPEQKPLEADVQKALAVIKTNALSVVSLMTLLANLFEPRKTGVIAVLSSVAGERGRAKMGVYGATKAMVTSFSSGLCQRLAPSGVRVITIKPGFVDTPMTQSFRKTPLFATSETVAKDIVKAMDSGNGQLYTPWFWRFIMLAVRSLPDVIFNKTRF